MWAWGNKPSMKGAYEAASPCVMSDLPQSYLEPILVEESPKLGAEYRFGNEYISSVEVDDGVVTTIRDRATKRVYEVKTQYLIGADGARSKVLEGLGIVVDGK